MEQFPRFLQLSKENLQYKLKRALYGLKQSPCIWYNCINNFLCSLDMIYTTSDHNLHYISKAHNKTSLIVYIDNLFSIK